VVEAYNTSLSEVHLSREARESRCVSKSVSLGEFLVSSRTVSPVRKNVLLIPKTNINFYPRRSLPSTRSALNSVCPRRSPHGVSIGGSVMLAEN
jgi:hypothetical protein